MRKFSDCAVAASSTIHNDGYPRYIPAFENYIHEHKAYAPNSGTLH